MMSKMSYAGLLNQTLDIYEKEGSLTAYKYITDNATKVCGNTAQLFNFRYSLASASGLEVEALNLMREAIIENGYWYEYDYLMADEDLISLRKYDEFDELVNICKEREVLAKTLAKPELKVINSKRTSSDLVIVAIHGDQENIEITEEYWPSIGNKLVLPQSSQIEFSNAYVWDDVDIGANELKVHVEQEGHMKSNQSSLIIGGFSAGCRVALKAILTKKVEAVDGLIFMAPWLPEIDEYEELIHHLKGIKVYVLCGDQDNDSLDCTKRFVEILATNNIAYSFKVIKDLSHEYPDDFNLYIEQGIDFISHI
ncbi:alpha/beta hydrolase [Virgibacillus sp. DJP39]|uniref:alpha/beta hydrolase n=1 Tax=Virgibacillus sp. DJP39 TaxID=3409790 RepID=UPI003BB4F54A